MGRNSKGQDRIQPIETITHKIELILRDGPYRWDVGVLRHLRAGR